MYIKFSHVSTENKVKCYNFDVYFKDVDGEETVLHFNTYQDFSGYSINYGVRKAEHLILIGTAILTNKEYIENQIKSNK